MSSNIAIKVENLSKNYDLLSTSEKENGVVKALNDVSFEINKGQSVGIIGANGSGKSTLLKILAGVSPPTEGRIEVNGRLASILEIGAGFHPELSGKDNVFLNGQILGFSKSEIQEHYNEIVDFSEIGNFIHEPVKNYSSGMYLRLAFSILIHLDFDVFLFDEVISVGDAVFQQKVRDKLSNLISRDKTILYVSHNISEIEAMDRFFLFDKGTLIESSYSKSLVKNYLEKSVQSIGKIKIVDQNTGINDFENHPKSEALKINHLKFYQEGSNDRFLTTKEFILELEYEKLKDEDTLDIVLNLNDIEGNIILTSTPYVNGDFSDKTSKGIYSIKCVIPANIFNAQIYKLTLFFVKNAQEIIDNRDAKTVNKHKSDQIALILTDVLVFRSYFEKNNQIIDLSALNLRGQMLVGFDWK